MLELTNPRSVDLPHCLLNLERGLDDEGNIFTYITFIRLPYEHYNGGVVALTKEQYFKINGFSNAYFGWGKEDDDLHKRLVCAYASTSV